VLLALGVLALVVVPGQPCGVAFGLQIGRDGGYVDTVWEVLQHGWPWMFLERDIDTGDTNISPSHPLAGDDNDIGAGWYMPRSWSFNADGLFFWGWALAGDLAVVLLILAAVAWLCEWRRRRRGRFFQYTLAEMMLAITLTACVLSWWCVHRNQRREETALAERLEGIYGVTLSGTCSARSSCGNWWKGRCLTISTS
jgi:hypothetical protein